MRLLFLLWLMLLFCYFLTFFRVGGSLHSLIKNLNFLPLPECCLYWHHRVMEVDRRLACLWVYWLLRFISQTSTLDDSVWEKFKRASIIHSSSDLNSLGTKISVEVSAMNQSVTERLSNKTTRKKTRESKMQRKMKIDNEYIKT